MTAGATLPPAGLPGLDPAWSRLVTDARGHRWHVLDTGDPGARATGTLVCVHGNPTWSYLWRRFLATAPPGWRVVAVDQLGMGWSQRLPAPRTLAERVTDLDAVLAALEVSGPVVIAGHDWGGAVALGWAVEHHDARAAAAGVVAAASTGVRVTAGPAAAVAVESPAGPAAGAAAPAGSSPRLVGMVLSNTGVARTAAAPALIRLARTPVLRHLVCAATPAFVRATSALSRPPLPRAVRDALAAPYGSAARRGAVEDFVADIPLEADHRSAATLDGIAEAVRRLDDVPVLLLWGPRDPVFSDRFLRDLRTRLPHADVQRYERASHLVPEDAPQAATDAWAWIGEHVPPTPPRGDPWSSAAPPDPPRGDTWSSGDAPTWTGWEARAGDRAPAVVEPGGRAISWDLFVRRAHELVVGLIDHGVAPGDRVALLVPPGPDLTVAAHACWRAGASVVVADPGLGAAGLARALRGAHPAHVIGAVPGLALAAATGVAAGAIAAGPVPVGLRRALGSPVTLTAVARRGRALLDGGAAVPPGPGPDAEAAVLFTSGATGPAKGVVYRHGQVAAQLAALRGAYAITADDRLVAAFPPFALYGPGLGIASAVPTVVAPGALTAAALAEAVAAVDATMVFASPAALRSVVVTGGDVSAPQRAALARVRRVVSAGAPVPATLLHALRAVLPHATAHTPYGMTEALPVTDVSLAGIEAAGPGEGVCVGRPLPGVDVAVSPLAPDGTAAGPCTREPGVTGEISVAAAHVKDRYDQLWAVQRASARDPGRHRTGDVGHLDAAGRLWVEGRLVHVVTTAAGPVTPVGTEHRVQQVDGVAAAAAVGVGPAGTQQVVVVVVPDGGVPARRPGAPLLADERLTAAVRRAAAPTCDPAAAPPPGPAGVPVAAVPIAAVLVADALPVDIRHAAKVDRTRVAAWATRVLAGERAGRRP